MIIINIASAWPILMLLYGDVTGNPHPASALRNVPGILFIFIARHFILKYRSGSGGKRIEMEIHLVSPTRGQPRQSPRSQGGCDFLLPAVLAFAQWPGIDTKRQNRGIKYLPGFVLCATKRKGMAPTRFHFLLLLWTPLLDLARYARDLHPMRI